MAIGSIGGPALSSLTQTKISPMRQKTAADLLKEMDTDQNGSVSKSEFEAFGEKMKAQGPGGSMHLGTPAPTPPSPNELFGATDANSDNALSVDELSAMMAKAETQRASRGGTSNTNGAHGSGKAGPPPGGGAGGPPPGGVAGGARGTAGTRDEDASSTSNATATDPADANEDGTVTSAERLIYELTHASAGSSSSTS